MRQHAEKRLEALRKERASYLQHWKELSTYILPRNGRFLHNDIHKGKVRNEKIIDNTATIAARTLASGMMAGITSPARQWFHLTTKNPTLLENKAVSNWLYEVEAIMRDTFAHSNLYTHLQTLYEELTVFGTGAMIIQADPKSILRCRTLTAGEYFIAQDDQQNVDTLCREFSMTIAQMVTAFGRESLSHKSKKMLENQKLDAWVDIVHIIEPNPNTLPHSLASSRLPYRSIYFEKNSSPDTLLRHSGYTEFPVVVPRWSLIGADIYGRSPGMDALPDVKQLQHEQLRKAQGIDKMVNPPMIAPAHMKGRNASVLPGGITYIDMQNGQSGFQPAYRVDPRLHELTLDIKETQGRINKTFYADLFLMLNEMERSQITAYEIDARREEKLLMLGPVLERLHGELLTPLVDRTFHLLERSGMLPEAPAVIANQNVHVSYTSMLDRAQQSQSLNLLERFITVLNSFLPIMPELIHLIDGPKALRLYAERLGIPANIIKSDMHIKEDQAQSLPQTEGVSETPIV